MFFTHSQTERCSPILRIRTELSSMGWSQTGLSWNQWLRSAVRTNRTCAAAAIAHAEITRLLLQHIYPNRSFLRIIAQILICEDAIQAPDPHVKSIVEHVGETVDETPESFPKIQSNEMTEYWLTQFQKKLSRLNITVASTPQRQSRRDLPNLGRLLT